MNEMINLFNKKKKLSEKQALKDDSQSLFIDFYFKNFRKTGLTNGDRNDDK